MSVKTHSHDGNPTAGRLSFMETGTATKPLALANLFASLMVSALSLDVLAKAPAALDLETTN